MKHLRSLTNVFILAFLLPLIVHAQDPALVWAKNMGGNGEDYGWDVDIDAFGNVYTMGSFSGIADFDSDSLKTFNLTSAGSFDVFITKLDAAGNLVWAKRIGGTDQDYGRSIAVDASGNVYTTGRFSGTADFDPDSLKTYYLTSTGPGSPDIFVVKLDAAGKLVWAKSMGGSQNYDDGRSIAVDASGNVYTTGSFSGTGDFDPDSLKTFHLTSTGPAVFISKLDAAGTFVWAKGVGGPDSADGNSITIDESGNIYLSGRFSGTVDFDPDSLKTFHLTSAGYADIFINKLDAAGTFVWAKSMGGLDYDEGHSITVDESGNVYAAGRFSGTADFDPDSLKTFYLTSAYSLDVFIVKLDAAGNLVWAKRIGGRDSSEFSSAGFFLSLAIDTSDNIYTTGSFAGTFDFNPDSMKTYNLSAAGSSDIFVSKLDADGNFVWARQMGGDSQGAFGSDFGCSIVIDKLDNVYTAGMFLGGVADFDPDSVGVFNLPSNGDFDAYVLKLSQCTTASAAFSWVTDGAEIQFENLSSGSTPTFFWNFGDGATSTLLNPAHTYLNDGTYTVTLTVTNPCGASTATQMVTIATPPTAGFTASPTSGCAPLTVEFTNTSSANATFYNWIFSGGTPPTSTEQNPSVVYNSLGDYPATLVVSNASGSDISTQQNFIHVIGPPTASFDFTSDGQTVMFHNSSQGADSYFWDFGDGQTSTEVNPTHDYDSSGVYTVILICFNPCGTDNTLQQLVGTNTPEWLHALHLYPNPATDYFTLHLQGEPRPDILVELLSSTGQTVFREALDFQSGTLLKNYSCRDVPAGMYLVRVADAQGSVMRKIVIE